MTGEEKNQVQNLINARMRLLNEKISLQEEQIASLSTELRDTKQELEASRKELEARDTEISSLKTRITEMQEQSRKLTAMLQTRRPEPEPKPTAPKPQKPNYLVSLLRQHFGYDSFRPGQEDIINALLSGRDVFCSMPDSYGKSICYRLPALLMPGITLVITPSEPPENIPDAHTESLTSSITPAKKRELLRKVRNGTCKLLYSALPQLKESDIMTALKAAEVSMIAMISPADLKECREYTDTITARRIPAGIFTGAESPAQRQEIMKALRTPLRIVTGFKRPEVSFRIVRTEDKPAALKDILNQKNGMNGVIFCSTPEEVYKLREILRDYDGIDERITIIPRVLYRQVAGNDIKFAVHYALPDTPASYAQETNSAKDECIIIASRKDLRNADKSVLRFINDKNPKEALASYLGEDENIAPSQDKQEDTKAKPEDFSDFDFGNANEAQKEAITSSSGPVLIIAGPGTGKTFTLVQRAVFLIQKRRVKPESIMMAAFTDKASKELTARITEELASRNIQADINAMYIGTFHVICQRILNDYAEYTGFRKNFRILDDFGQTYIILQNMAKFDEIPDIEKIFVHPGKWKRAGELRDCINSLSEELIDPEELMRDDDPAVKALGQALKVHDEILTANNSMSCSAMLSVTYRLLRDNPAVLSSLQEKIKYIMIDEYQDTNYVQEQLIFLLGGENKNICVVGDDDQSLYRFRGATVRNILEFPGRFGKSECRTVRLMLNYRSRPDIINFFSEWMNDTGKFFGWGEFRNPKKLEAYRSPANTPSVIRLAGMNDKEEWHEHILAFIKSLNVSDYNQIVFLFRSVKSRDAQELSQYLENHNISVYSPRSSMFFKRSEIHFALGCLISMFPEYLKSLNSGAFSFQGTEPDYITYYRNCLKHVARYIDKPQYASLKKWLLDKRNYHGKLNGYTNYTYSDLMYELFAFLPFNHALDADINGSVKDLRPARNLARLVKVLRDYEYSYNVNNINSKYMAAQFMMLMNIYMRFQLEEGLDEYESDDGIIPSGHVAFMTIHQAKGMEFPVVFVDSLWSSPRPDNNRGGELVNSIEHDYSRRPEFEPEEQIKFFDFWRLFYVAFSRARDLLVLTCLENPNSPSKYFDSPYNKLEDAEEAFNPSEIEISASRDSGLKNIYSFTSHILLYETCPMQYKFFRELEFTPHISNSTFLGTLVHATIEDIHRAVLNSDSKSINEQNISEWLNANYEYLSRTGQVYLNQASRDTAFSQVMRYVRWNGADWSAVARAETELNLVRDDYILEGKIDLLCIRDGEVEIVDFKSGPKPNININRDREHLETYRRQLNVYAYLAGHSLGLEVDRMKLYYTGEEDKDPEITYTYDKNEADGIMKGFDETVSRIMAKDFNHRAKDPDVCRECGFRFYCGRG